METNKEYVFLAKRNNALDDFLLGKIYPFAMTHYAGDDLIPSSTEAIVKSVLEAYADDVSVKKSFEQSIKRLIKADDYSFVVAMKTIYFYITFAKYTETAFPISQSIMGLMKSEYAKRSDRIRENGITTYSGKKKYPTGDMKRMMSAMEEE